MHFNMLNSEAQWHVSRYVLVKLSTISKSTVCKASIDDLTIALGILYRSVMAFPTLLEENSK